VVVLAVEGGELLVGQIRDVGRIAARIDPVDGVREQRALRALHEETVGRGVDAFHLVEDDALVGQGVGHVLQFVMPALLLVGVAREERVEHGVKVHVDQVVEVLPVLAGHRVAGLVGVGEGVQERLQGALQQFDERLLGGIAARSAQHGVLEDMGHPGMVARRGAEGDAEHLVLVIDFDGQQLGARLHMPEQVRPGLQLRQFLGSQQLKTVLHHGVSREWAAP
jgi:hypothetical protein